MPVTVSAKKALRRDRRRTTINKRLKVKVKAAIKTVQQKPTPKNLSQVFSVLDQAKKKKIIHKNKAARLKSQLSQLLKKKKSHPAKTKPTKASKAKTAKTKKNQINSLS